MLADEHQVSERPRRGRVLLPRFEENGRYLIAAYRKLTEAVFEGQGVSPAAEWLIDNFHVVEEQLREIRVDLPKSYYYELPKLVTGEMRATRVSIQSQSPSSRTPTAVSTRITGGSSRAYQQVTPLTIGEMWARRSRCCSLLDENLRRLTVRVVAAREEREEADRLADNLLVATDEADPLSSTSFNNSKKETDRPRLCCSVDAAFARPGPGRDAARRMDRARRKAMVRRRADCSAKASAPGRLASDGRQHYHEYEAAFDDRLAQFVESVSLTEPILGADPAGAYAEMDFATRDRCRHVMERIARRTSASELDVARRAIELAKAISRARPANRSVRARRLLSN